MAEQSALLWYKLISKKRRSHSPVNWIYILANSMKKSQHCIAGRELIDFGGKFRIGRWIRPMSRHEEGELSWSYCRFPNGRTPDVFDAVDIPLEGPEGSQAQPENWFIDCNRAWSQVNIRGELPKLETDHPQHLWLQTGGRLDRISPHALAGLRCGSSLYLIQVGRFRIQPGWREYQGKFTRRRRALFEYQGRNYDFSLMDPKIQDKTGEPFPEQNQPAKTIKLDSGGDCLLCVSLAPPFNGYHYKIVATVIEKR